jgi:hypothetical protein
MVAYSCVGVSRVTIRLKFARIAEWQGSVVRVHLISSRRGGRTWVTMPDPESLPGCPKTYATMRDAQAQPSNWGVEPASGRPVVPNHFRSSRAAVPSWYIAVIALFTASQPSMSPLRKPTP